MKLRIEKYQSLRFSQSSDYDLLINHREIEPGEIWTNYINVYWR
jgi:hypothetical protein